MTAHISDELPRLLTGDATRDVVLEAASHLRTCDDCMQELVSAVVAHASLTSAHRFAPEILAADSDVADARDQAPAGPLPDLSSIFAKAREEAAATTKRPKRLRTALAVAAAAVVIGGGTATVVAVTSGSDGTATRQVALAPFGVGKTPAKVTIIGTSRMKIDATSLPKLDSKHQYEVWLTDNVRKHMQSVGFIGNDLKADLPVPAKVMSHYADIEVSVQKIDQDQYSGTSVLRGSYG
jgi:hypothetical protein